MAYSSKIAGQNGTHVETLILGYPSNPERIIDDPEHKIEIKSCRERHITSRRGKPSTRMGAFKINVDQHQHLLEIGGSYHFAVQDEDLGKIIHEKIVLASEVEQQCHFLARTVTKHHYFSLNWRKVIS